MKVFVTGASGWIGSAVVTELLAAGHQVAGLARSDRAADALVEAGVEPVRGTLDDTEVLAHAAADADGVIHLAFNHEIAFGAGDFAAAALQDRVAVEAMGTALQGSGKPFVIASGTPDSVPGALPTEADGHEPAEGGDPGLGMRLATAEWALGLAADGVRPAVVRLPPSNHGEGDHGFVAGLAGVARATGVSAYVGAGDHRWSTTHRLDTARVIRLALEKAPAGATLHAVAEEAVPTREIAAAIGEALGLPVRSVDPQDALAHFGWLAMPFGADRAASSAHTRDLLGWEPTHPGLLDDIRAGRYPGDLPDDRGGAVRPAPQPSGDRLTVPT